MAGLGILHTYVFYPWWTIRTAKRLSPGSGYLKDVLADKVAEPVSASPPGEKLSVQPNQHSYFDSHDTDDLPRVTVLMAVHNEEKVLAQKLDGLLAQDYPGTYRILVGSDNSSDRTNEILQDYAEKDKRLEFIAFQERQGKPGIINQLSRRAGALSSNHFFLLTDASVMLQADVLSALIAPTLTHADLAVIDARMIHVGMQDSGIGKTEDHYINGEVRLKQAEGRLWGYMMGPFGGCYALRSDYFVEVPATFLVDDFFLCLAAYEQGGRGISSPLAHCYEGVGQELTEEFRRKVRISSGNWQNALRFRSSWWPPIGQLGFAFFSHKILRWLTPFLVLVILVSLLTLSLLYSNYWAGTAFAFLLAALLLPALLDRLLTGLFNLHWQPLRALRYFTAMNQALLVGFFRYLKGIQSNVWQPTQRH
ncbi:glycosyl transferase family 2 [Lewinellaceae bacterium SD302]|nr:glycosyl transferase family 2 [Lewinellaceae bacterium SD302]